MNPMEKGITIRNNLIKEEQLEATDPLPVSLYHLPVQQ
jgi:hypothetical protein